MGPHAHVHDGRRGEGRPHRGLSGSDQDDALPPAPQTPIGRVSARDNYIASKLSDLTAGRNPTADGTGQAHPGLVHSTLHNTDSGGGLHTGSLDDLPTQVGGYGRMDHGTATKFLTQFGGEFDRMAPEEQGRWHPGQDTPGTGTNATSYLLAQASPGSSVAAPAALHDANLTAGNGGNDATPANAGSYLRTNGLPPANPAARAMRDSAQISGGLGNGGGGYGKVGQVDSPEDLTTTDSAGNRHVSTAAGGSVDLPAVQPQTAPTGGGSGISVNGVPQTRDANGSFVAAFTPPTDPGKPPAASDLFSPTVNSLLTQADNGAPFRPADPAPSGNPAPAPNPTPQSPGTQAAQDVRAGLAGAGHAVGGAIDNATGAVSSALSNAADFGTTLFGGTPATPQERQSAGTDSVDSYMANNPSARSYLESQNRPKSATPPQMAGGYNLSAMGVDTSGASPASPPATMPPPPTAPTGTGTAAGTGKPVGAPGTGGTPTASTSAAGAGAEPGSAQAYLMGQIPSMSAASSGRVTTNGPHQSPDDDEDDEDAPKRTKSAV